MKTPMALLQQTVLDYYQQHGRHDLPWRIPEPGPGGHFDPYKILISELMLQQTQVGRVVPKFRAFAIAYPSAQALAEAPLADVLAHWNGLGYNRRAKFLWQTAQVLTGAYNGALPQKADQLTVLPGVGPNTAGAILAYAFNQPVAFIETNIRTVFIHHFFTDETEVSDTALRPLVESSLQGQEPRQWYWALMDYGAYLKQTVGNVSRGSAAYTKQSTFLGSRRQVRGKVLRVLMAAPLSRTELQERIQDERLGSVLADLKREGFITQTGASYRLGA